MNACNFEIGIKPAPFHCFRLKKTNYNRSNRNRIIESIILLSTKSNNNPLKMFTFIICELLLMITFIAGTLFCYKIHNKVHIIIQMLFQAIKSRTIKSKYQLLLERKYLSSLWESLNKSFDKISELDSVLFNKVVIKLCERKGIIIAFILEGHHQQKKQFLRKTIEAL